MNKENLLVLDADSIPFTVCHNKKDQIYEKTLEECISLADNYIKNIIINTNSNYFIGFLTRGKCFRYTINSDYKSNRKKLEPLKHSFEVREYIEKKYKLISYKDLYEADDLILSSINQLKANFNCIACSSDKDILKIVNKGYDIKKMSFVENTNLEIVENFWKSMIVGDPADFIKGIPGKGIKYAENLFKEKIKYNNELEYSELVFSSYLTNLGLKGIDDFYKNYKCLKILDDIILNNLEIIKTEEILCE